MYRTTYRHDSWYASVVCSPSHTTDLGHTESKAYKSINDNGDEVIVERNMQVIREVTSDCEETKLGEYLDILDALFEDDYTQQPRGVVPIASKQEKVMI